MNQIYLRTCELGYYCKPPLAIFFDLAIEQPDKVVISGEIDNLKININNFKKHLTKDMMFASLSDLNKNLFEKIGYNGIIEDPIPVPDDIFKRVVERGRKFYELFGWDDYQIIERSKSIASSEALVGDFLRNKYNDSILVYTPTMLERAAIYSGLKYKTDPLPIIFPRH